MSWGIEVTGTREGVKKAVAEQLDKCAANYAGKPEADDIASCKTRALALVDALDMTPDYGMTLNGVIVKANGSHSSNGKGVTSADFTLRVVRTVLALDGDPQ